MRIIDFFDNGADQYPENTAFIDGDALLSYKEAAKETHLIANAIRHQGYGAGTKVGILSPNSTDAFLALLGILRCQSVWLPVNPKNSVGVNVDILSRFGCDILLYHSLYEAEATAIGSEIASIRALVCIDRMSKEHNSLLEWKKGQEQVFVGEDWSMGDVTAIFPTGGTTGKPKGVLMTHRAIFTMFANFYAHFSYHDNTAHLVVAPMTHSAGLIGCMHFARGGTNVIMRDVVPEQILRNIEAHNITHLFLPPTVLYVLLSLPNAGDFNYSSLQHLLIGAAPTSTEKLKQAIDVFGPVLTEAFGQTEAPAAILAKSPWDYINEDGSINEARLASAGRPCVLNKVAILDDNGNSLPKGEAGEIAIMGDLVTPGYYENPEETAKVRKKGWHLTGDVGVMSDDGFITIVDRKKDMIITGGFNVFPNEIEQILNSHDAVQDCAVIGIPDEKWGEAVKGVVQIKVGYTVTSAELIALVKEALGSVKAPKSIDFSENLPRSPNGKVLKTDIRKLYWRATTRAIN